MPLRGGPEGFGHPVAGSLATILRQYKGAVTRLSSRETGTSHLWQRGYYERIIRDQREWEKIHLYIESNPSGWETDEENPEGGERSAYSSRLTR